MIHGLLLSMALVGQGQGPEFVGPPAPPARKAAPAASTRRQDELRRTAEKQRARRSARVRGGMAREQAAYDADVKAQAKAEADFKAALPFMLEAQRMQLQRMSAMERNAALARMAKADERMARAMEFKAGVPQYAPYDGSGPVLPPPPAPIGIFIP